MKKQLDTAAMENELRSGSAFFREVPANQNQAITAQNLSPTATSVASPPQDAAPPGVSSLEPLPATRPPIKEAAQAPAAPLERFPRQQPGTSPPLQEQAPQMARERVGVARGRFAPPAPLPPATPEPGPGDNGGGGTQETKEPRNQGSWRDEQQVSQMVTQDNSPGDMTIPFEPDLPRKQRLYRKQTFEFSKEELDFLEEAKFDLRDLEVTKNEIVRTALELLAKDYQANKETCFLVRKFTGQPGGKGMVRK